MKEIIKNLILGLSFLLVACNSNSGKLSSILDPNKAEKEKIKNQIENAYFGITNGSFYTNTSPDNLPFYNVTGKMVMTLIFAQMFSDEPVSIEPANIKILNINDKSADVSYDLILIEGKNKTTSKVSMKLKKVGGNWKLDAQKLFNSSLEDTDEKVSNEKTNKISGNYPQASTRLLTKDELSNMDKTQLKIMRNEIYARYGYIFTNPTMEKYFNSQSWYVPKYNDVTPFLSKIEKENVVLIESYE